MTKIFIDGEYGTTGLKIRERFLNRSDISLLKIDEASKKDPAKKQAFLNEADFVFLCLPDAAAIESVRLVTNPATRVIDCSTAHRCSPDWAYGFPELSKELRLSISQSKRVATPGCYASGAVAILRPLVDASLLPKDYPVTIHAISGYSGGGKKAIAQYNGNECPKTPRLYALTQNHKHLPEIQKYAGLSYPPIFMPYICNYYQGMCVTVGLQTRLLSKKVGPADVHEIFEKHYGESHFVRVLPLMDGDEMNKIFLGADGLNNTNFLDLNIYGNDDRIVITSTLDNLGKGASGAAVQCLNIMMGVDETLGL